MSSIFIVHQSPKIYYGEAFTLSTATSIYKNNGQEFLSAGLVFNSFDIMSLLNFYSYDEVMC